jgi:hypothetical protein
METRHRYLDVVTARTQKSESVCLGAISRRRNFRTLQSLHQKAADFEAQDAQVRAQQL